LYYCGDPASIRLTLYVHNALPVVVPFTLSIQLLLLSSDTQLFLPYSIYRPTIYRSAVTRSGSNIYSILTKLFLINSSF